MASLGMHPVARASILATMTVLAACSRTYAPGPGVEVASFEPTKARCSLMARHSGGSFSAYGRPSVVAGAGALFLAAEAARTRQDMDDCMVASGWRIVEANSTTQSAASQTPANQPAVTARFADIATDARACTQAVRSRPAYDALRPHFSDITTGNYTPEQLADTRIPSPAEAAVLAAFGEAVSPCISTAISALSRVAPGAQDILLDKQRMVDAEFAALARRQISWGEYATRVVRINAETIRRLRAPQA